MITSLLFSAHFSAFATTPQDAIRAQQGCYRVTFQYMDTASLHDDYALRPPKKSEAIEWVHLESDSPDRIVLQHVLVSGPAMIKHWRQEWVFEETALLHFEGNGTWRHGSITPEAAAGTWTQKVYNVDDGPRYTCAAAWDLDGEHPEWRCASPSPLPRRDKDIRRDYDILDRVNIHRIEGDSWVHEQRNTRVRLDGDTLVPLGEEHGYNTYDRVPDAQCQEAMDWWPGQQQAWYPIQDAWDDLVAANSLVVLREARAGMPRWIRLFLLARRAERRDLPEAQVHKRATRIISRYLTEDSEPASVDALSEATAP